MSRSDSTVAALRPDSTLGLELPEVLSADQVAEFLGVNRKTVYEAIQSGQIPGKRIGKRRVVIFRRALLRSLSS